MNEERLEAYVNLMQVLRQATATSKGNPQVIYSLLRENLDKLDDNFARVLQEWTMATLPKVEAGQAISIAVDIANLSNLIGQFPLGSKASNMEIAITGYQVALTVFTHNNYSETWALIQSNLGAAYRNRIQGEQADNIEKAITCYQEALQVLTPEAFPQQWAMTQNNLGLAYTNRIREQRAANLEEAIICYQKALQVLTPEAFPQQWAMTQNNLGFAYSNRIREERASNLEKAITCFQAALQVLSYEAFPADWAITQNNLGNAYSNRIQRERADNLEKAIACFEAALQVLSCEAFPIDWATTQNNLGIAYCQRIREQRADNLEKAITCYQAALQVRTREAFPTDWATTQNNLGTAYLYKIKGERADNWDKAIACFQAALQVRTLKAFPQQWAMTQHNLGTAYCDIISEERADNLEEAIACFHAALRVRTREAFPTDWATTQNNLGTAYYDRIREERPFNLEKAIASYQQALQVYTPETFPQNHAETQFNLGVAYQDVRQFPNAYHTFAAAIDTVEFLRGEIISGSGIEGDKQKLAEEWNNLYRRMVEVCVGLAKDEPKYYDQAIEYVERSKARNLVELLANKDLYPKRDLYSNPEDYQTDCDQLDQLRREIPAKQRELEMLIRSRETEQRYRDEIERRRQELNHLQQQRDNLLGEINKADSSFTFTQKVEPIPFSDIQALTDDRTAIVQWYITGTQILTFIITRHNPHPIVVPSSPENQKALEEWDKEYRDSYRQQKSQWITNLASRLQHLGEILHIDDVLARINDIFEQKAAKCDRLILIPHRFLHLFPLHALPLDNGDSLCDRFPKGVGYAPSCQLLQLTQQRERPDFSNLFAIQNPTDDLLYTNLEVETIRSSFPSAQVLVKQAATKTALNASQDLPLAHCNHFSCHGEFNLTSPLESALLLANKERLTLGEIFGLNLNQCRLVTLSACETGLSDPTSVSDEYISLPSGFLYAGSPSIVSSLWTVNDLSTAFLMLKFYENFQSSRKQAGDVAIALNQAQQWLRNLTIEKLDRFLNKHKPQLDRVEAQLRPGQSLIFQESLRQIRQRQPLPFANPYYWAAFTATGL